ncbi:ATP-binding protein [Pseudoduganella sp. GCM10020061]|uniref:hybrid sensor histidine kinase/response regulator n=1 Tax=Pseudoduganella sp. GCM10020061 TaxID=3317345 RepID=UPI003629B6D0
MPVAQLRATVAALTSEVSALREQLALQSELSQRVAQLREANEHLVLASISADNRRDEAEEANRRQNEFLAMLAHELRNPLAPISMAATLLERTPNLPPQLGSLQRVISRQVEQMARLLDDLLDAARISSGKITLTLEPVVLSDLIERAVETIAPRIAERGQKLILAVPPDPVVLDGNRVRLTQVFSNLLANASKYTQDGGEIVVSAHVEGERVCVCLKDNGTGMAADVLPHIFDLFTQGPRSLARSEGGLGVGLNVVRNVVHMHGGEVSAASPGPGQGSEFTVVLPLARGAVEVAEAAPVEEKPWRCCRVLLVEDNVDACVTLDAFLSSHGHQVRMVHDGAEGLKLALDGDYDLLICDIGLPGLDGYALIRQLREQRGAGQPYAIALSGYCQPEDREKALEAGFDAFLVKPVDSAVLVEMLTAGTRMAAPL